VIARRKHQPQRTCLVCRSIKDKRELIRIVRTPEQQVIIDPTGKANGRGVYLCRQGDCWRKGLKKERLSHALKVEVAAADVVQLQTTLQAELGESDLG
jgi:predicted RNA-binding protein YlxR (DUF448 family)